MPAQCPCDPCACETCVCACGANCKCGESCSCDTPAQVPAEA